MFDDKYILVVGGATIDIQGFPYEKLKFSDSNPGVIKTSLGGVGRNIADNLSRLSLNVKFITAIGDDLYGKKILKEGELGGIDFSHSLIIEDKPTSTYLSILNESGEMAVAISYMDILENITTDFIDKKSKVIENSLLTVLDTNLSFEALDHITSKFSKMVFFLDTVSTKKATKVKDIIGRFHTIKPNKLECEILTGIEIKDKDDIKRIEEYFLNKGIKRIFITLGEDGLFYSNGSSNGFIKKTYTNIVNVTGAGDAFVAALVYGYVNNFDINYTAKFATASSLLALSHEDTINPMLSVSKIKDKIKILEENKNI